MELSKIKNIVAVKEASGDLKQVAEIIRDAQTGFKVYSGNDGDTFPIVALGGTGVVSVASHIIGKEIKEMIKFIKKSNIDQAASLHKKYLDIFYGIFITTSPIPIKRALNLKGMNVGPLRPPLYEMETKEKENFDKILSEYNII
ncbi:MAG: dihydrodipicolinate synthase family protein [Actinomycetota bacterium]|nr:dihydrodipicolinate synthase family protein [Actinomycetota bacterium]